MVKTSRVVPPEEKEIVELIKGCEGEDDQELLAVLYLTGARISEVVKVLRKKDFDFETDPDVVVVTVHTEKRKRGIPIRKVPYRKTDPLAFYVERKLSKLEGRDGVLFDMHRSTAWRHLKDVSPRLWCHLLRHARFTHLVSKKGMDLNQLVVVAGWSDPSPAKTYVHLTWEDAKENV